MSTIVDLVANVNASAVHLMGNVDTTEIIGASKGLAKLWSNFLTNWITPLYIAMVAVFALFFLKDRAWMKLIGFVGIAAVVGVLVFAGSSLFGKSGNLTKTATGLAKDVNVVDAGKVADFASQTNHFAE